jgi:hypothetical protein
MQCDVCAKQETFTEVGSWSPRQYARGKTPEILPQNWGRLETNECFRDVCESCLKKMLISDTPDAKIEKDELKAATKVLLEVDEFLRNQQPQSWGNLFQDDVRALRAKIREVTK